MGGGSRAGSVFFGKKRWQGGRSFHVVLCCVVVHFSHESSPDKERELGGGGFVTYGVEKGGTTRTVRNNEGATLERSTHTHTHEKVGCS